jgi:hypothetical protein
MGSHGRSRATAKKMKMVECARQQMAVHFPERSGALALASQDQRFHKLRNVACDVDSRLSRSSSCRKGQTEGGAAAFQPMESR